VAEQFHLELKKLKAKIKNEKLGTTGFYLKTRNCIQVRADVKKSANAINFLSLRKL
jgi:hypothetical protein